MYKAPIITEGQADARGLDCHLGSGWCCCWDLDNLGGLHCCLGQWWHPDPAARLGPWSYCSWDLCWSLRSVLPPKVTMGDLQSEPQHVALLVSVGHATARPILIWVVCASTRSPSCWQGPCPGPWSHCSWSLCWRLWPVLPEGVTGAISNEVRGPCWASPALRWPWRKWPCSSLDTAARSNPHRELLHPNPRKQMATPPFTAGRGELALVAWCGRADCPSLGYSFHHTTQQVIK